MFEYKVGSNALINYVQYNSFFYMFSEYNTYTHIQIGKSTKNTILCGLCDMYCRKNTFAGVYLNWK